MEPASPTRRERPIAAREILTESTATKFNKNVASLISSIGNFTKQSVELTKKVGKTVVSPVTASVQTIGKELDVDKSKAISVGIARATHPIVGYFAEKLIEKNEEAIKQNISSTIAFTKSFMSDQFSGFKSKITGLFGSKSAMGESSNIMMKDDSAINNMSDKIDNLGSNKNDESSSNKKSRINRGSHRLQLTTYTRTHKSTDVIEAVDLLRISNAEWIKSLGFMTKDQIERKPLPKAKEGGFVSKTGKAIVHTGEVITPYNVLAKQTNYLSQIASAVQGTLSVSISKDKYAGLKMSGSVKTSQIMSTGELLTKQLAANKDLIKEIKQLATQAGTESKVKSLEQMGGLRKTFALMLDPFREEKGVTFQSRTTTALERLVQFFGAGPGATGAAKNVPFGTRLDMTLSKTLRNHPLFFHMYGYMKKLHGLGDLLTKFTIGLPFRKFGAKSGVKGDTSPDRTASATELSLIGDKGYQKESLSIWGYIKGLFDGTQEPKKVKGSWFAKLTGGGGTGIDEEGGESKLWGQRFLDRRKKAKKKAAERGPRSLVQRIGSPLKSMMMADLSSLFGGKKKEVKKKEKTVFEKIVDLTDKLYMGQLMQINLLQNSYNRLAGMYEQFIDYRDDFQKYSLDIYNALVSINNQSSDGEKLSKKEGSALSIRQRQMGTNEEYKNEEKQTGLLASMLKEDKERYLEGRVEDREERIHRKNEAEAMRKGGKKGIMGTIIGALMGIPALIAGAAPILGSIVAFAGTAVSFIAPFTMLLGIIEGVMAWFNAEKIFDLKKGDKATYVQKISSAIGGFINGLIFRIPQMILKLGIWAYEYISGDKLKKDSWLKQLANFDFTKWIAKFVEQGVSIIKDVFQNTVDVFANLIYGNWKEALVSYAKIFIGDVGASMLGIGDVKDPADIDPNSVGLIGMFFNYIAWPFVAIGEWIGGKISKWMLTATGEDSFIMKGIEKVLGVFNVITDYVTEIFSEMWTQLKDNNPVQGIIDIFTGKKSILQGIVDIVLMPFKLFTPKFIRKFIYGIIHKGIGLLPEIAQGLVKAPLNKVLGAEFRQAGIQERYKKSVAEKAETTEGLAISARLMKERELAKRTGGSRGTKGLIALAARQKREMRDDLPSSVAKIQKDKQKTDLLSAVMKSGLRYDPIGKATWQDALKSYGVSTGQSLDYDTLSLVISKSLKRFKNFKKEVNDGTITLSNINKHVTPSSYPNVNAAIKAQLQKQPIASSQDKDKLQNAMVSKDVSQTKEITKKLKETGIAIGEKTKEAMVSVAQQTSNVIDNSTKQITSMVNETKEKAQETFRSDIDPIMRAAAL